MLIKKIKMHNFRQYKHAELEFSTDPESNITLVMGDNGTGKTTLAQAFLWCLFGNTDFEVQEVINRKVRDTLTLGSSEITCVEMLVNYKDVDYTISREQEFKKGIKKIEVSKQQLKIHYKENGNLQYLSDNEKYLMIKRMLPKELSRFFFFDGERIRIMSDEINHGKSRDFKEAVMGLVGLVSMQNAIQHLKPSTSASTVIGYYNKKIDEKGGEDLNKYSENISKLFEEKKQLIDRLENIEPQIRSYEEQSISLKAEILNETPEIERRKNYENLLKDIDGLEKRRIEKINVGILKKFGSNMYDYIASVIVGKAEPYLSDIKESTKEIPLGIEAPSIKYLLGRGRCICGEPLEVGDDHYNELYSLLDIVPPKTTGKMVSEVKNRNKIVNRNAEGIFQQFQQQMIELRGLESDIDKKRQKATDLFNTLSDTSAGERAKEKLSRIEPELNRLKKEQTDKKSRIETLEKDIKIQEAEKEKLINISEENKRYIRYRAYAKYIYDEFSKKYNSLEKSTRYKLERKINEIFPQIYDGGLKIEVDDKYNIKVLVDDAELSDDEIEKNTAQSYSVIFAFITSVIAMAKEKAEDDSAILSQEEQELFSEAEGYPLVMDAPLSNFDKTRIKQICTILPSIANQVVFFIKDTDGDVAEQHMLSKIGKKYIIKTVEGSKTHSKIDPVGEEE